MYFSRLNVGVGSTTELTYEGVQFLTRLFEKYDEVRPIYRLVNSVYTSSFLKCLLFSVIVSNCIVILDVS